MLEKLTDKERDYIFLTDYNCFGKFANALAYQAIFKTYLEASNPLVKKIYYSQLHHLFCSSLEDYAHFLTSLVKNRETKQSFLKEFSKGAREGVSFPAMLKKDLSHVQMLKFLGLNSKTIGGKISVICQQKKPKDFLEERFALFRHSIGHFASQKDGRQIIYVKYKHGKVLVSSNSAYYPNDGDIGFMAISYSDKLGKFENLTVTLDQELLGLFFVALLDIIDQIKFLSLCYILRSYGVKKINDFIATINNVSDPIENSLKEFWKTIPEQYFPKKTSPS